MLSRIGASYSQLLTDIINVSVELSDATSERVQTHGQTLIIPNADMTGVRRLKIDSAVIELTPDQLYVIDENLGTCQTPAYIQYVRYQPGIPRKLFDYVASMYKPVHVEVAKTILQIALIMALLYFSVVILKHFNRTTDVAGILHVMTLVAVGALPRVLSAMFAGNRSTQREGVRRQLKATIRNYWDLLAFNEACFSSYDECYMTEVE